MDISNNALGQCKNCGWIHFTVSRAYAENEVKEFNAYFDSLTVEQQNENYGGKPSSLRNYTHCDRCDREADLIKPTKSLYGSTIGPIIWEKDLK